MTERASRAIAAMSGALPRTLAELRALPAATHDAATCFLGRRSGGTAGRARSARRLPPWATSMAGLPSSATRKARHTVRGSRSPARQWCFPKSPSSTITPPTANGRATQHAFATTGMSLWQRINQQTHHGCMHIFGLFRADYLRDYTWSDIESGPDVIMLLTIGTLAEFVYQPGAMFYYYRPPNRDSEQRARESTPNSRGLRPFHPERLAWLAATGMAEASRRIGCPRSRLRLFLYLYYQMTQGTRGIIFRWTPFFLRRVARRLKLALAVHSTVSRWC